MSKLIFIIALGVAGWIVYHFARQNYQKHGKAYLIKVGLIALAAIILIAVITGRAPALFALFAAIIPFLGRMAGLLRYWPLVQQFFNGGANSAPGNQSQVRTQWLTMVLNHDSGAIDGEVLEGPLRGRKLSSLTLAELRQLYADCQANDPEAQRLLDVYAQRERAGEWQAQAGQGEQQPGVGGVLRTEDAWSILGLEPGASKKDIIATHRRLMHKFHPDKGGSNYLASQINRAKDVLLKAAGE